MSIAKNNFLWTINTCHDYWNGLYPHELFQCSLENHKDKVSKKYYIIVVNMLLDAEIQDIDL